MEVIGATRSGRGPVGVPTQHADVTDAASLAQLLRAGDLVVNCVGPFHYDPTSLVAACVAARAHYCDLADDVAFADRVRAAAHTSRARDAGVAVVTGASTVPGTIGVLARALERAPRTAEIARVSAYLSVGSRNPVSAGLLASLLAPLGRIAPDGHRWFSKRRVLRARDGRTLHLASHPAPFADGSLSLGSRRVAARLFFGFDRRLLTELLRLAAPFLGVLPERAIAPIAHGLLPLARAARVLGTPHGLLAVVAEDSAGRELARIELTASERGLDLPAAPPAWITARLARGHALPAGCVELADVVPLEDALAWLRAEPAVAISGVPLV